MKRLGRFTITDAAKTLAGKGRMQALFGMMHIVFWEPRPDTEDTRYVALCDAFDPIGEGDDFPEYVWVFDADRGWLASRVEAPHA